jgi:O-antigen ligase/polysaccharide polymerase Wzy-like membrane protein
VNASRQSRLTGALFLATVFTITFTKLYWSVAGDVALADVLTVLFLVSFASERLARADGSLPRATVSVLVFLGLFLLVYLIGFFNLETEQGLEQFGKGLVKFLLHFFFLAAGVAYLIRRSERFYWATLTALVVGMAANAAYGMVQLAAARAGFNLDEAVLSPLTGGASSINVYGGFEGEKVYRTNALTGDPNHLGIMLLVPLLVVAPLYLRLERGHRLRLPLALLLGFLLIVQLSTLSRSGLLGLATGLAVLALPYRRLFVSRALVVPLAAVGLLVAYLVYRRLDFFTTVLRSRVDTSSRSTSAHFDVYDFIPDVLSTHPLFGLGLNNFSVYYEFVTGKTNWGPHSFYVALVVETGLVGTVLFAVFLRYLFLRLRAARAVGRALAVARDPVAARVRPLAWGLTAALAGTLAANLFYLTMIFYYFYAFVILALTAPVVFGRRLRV